MNQKPSFRKSPLFIPSLFFITTGTAFLLLGTDVLHAYLTNPTAWFGAIPDKSVAANKSNDLVGVFVCGIIGGAGLALGLAFRIMSTKPLSWRHAPKGVSVTEYSPELVGVSQPTGVIKSISTMTGMIDLFVYSDAFVVAEGGLERAMAAGVVGGIAGGAGFGYLANRAVARQGIETGTALENNRIQGEMDMSPASLLSHNPRNKLVPLDKVVSAQLSNHAIGGRLIVQIADGSYGKFEWKGIYNRFEDAAALLQRALGAKLVVQN